MPGFPRGSPGFRFRTDCLHAFRHPLFPFGLPGFVLRMYLVQVLRNLPVMLRSSGIMEFPPCRPCRFMNGSFDVPGGIPGVFFHLFHIEFLLGKESQKGAEQQPPAQGAAMMPAPEQQISQRQ